MGELQEKRNQLYRDLWAGKRPERVPIQISAMMDYGIDYFGYKAGRDLYSPQICYDIADKLCAMYEGDTVTCGAVSQNPIYRYVKQAFMVPGDDGFLQHPNIAPMEFDEYPEYNKDPLKFIYEKIHPRVFGLIDDDPVYGQLKVAIARNVLRAAYNGLGPNLADKYERVNIVSSPIILWAPFDFIADYIRSFSTILMDIRRKPEWVLEACEKTCDYEIEQSKMLPKPAPGMISYIQMPLHMAPYMKPKDFEKFYWPTYQRVVEGFQEVGWKVQTHAEEDWTPHLDAINDLPGRCQVAFEKAHPSDVVKKVQPKHIFTNMYPSTILRDGTVQQCIDKAKEYLDILMPNGNYIFSPQKGMMRKSDVKEENVKAVIEFVREYGVYK